MGGLSWNIQEGFGAPFGRELNGRVMNRIQAAMTERHPFRPGLHVDDEVATPTSCVCSAAFIRRDSLQGKRRRDDTFDVDSMFLVYRVTPCALHNGLFGARSPQLVFLRETGGVSGERGAYGGDHRGRPQRIHGVDHRPHGSALDSVADQPRPPRRG